MKAALRFVMGLAVVVGLGLLGLHTALQAGTFTPRIAAALERATGRAVTLGPIGLRLAWQPVLSVSDVTIADHEGRSTPGFARIGQLDLTLALRPLLAGEFDIREIVLRDSDLLLERDAAGQPSWPAQPAGGGGGAVTVAALRMEAARLHLSGTWFGIIEISSLTLRRKPEGDALRLDASVTLRGEALTLAVDLDHPSNETPGLIASINGTGVRLAARGAVARRLDHPGLSLALEAETQSVARLLQLVGAPPADPPLGPLHGTATLGPGLVLSSITITTGEADLGTLVPGLRIQRGSLSAAGLDAPLQVTAQGRRAGTEARLEASMGAPRLVFGGAATALWPVTASLAAGPARLTAQGQASRADPFGAAPFEVTLAAPNLSTLGRLLDIELPDLRDVRASGQVERGPSGVVSATAIRVAAAPLQASGALEITWAPRPALTGQISFTRFDLDALGGPSTPRRDGRLIPDLALPVAPLRAMDATLNLSAETLAAGGLTWRAVRADVSLASGLLSLRSFSATSPGGPVSGRLTLDATATPPAATLALQSGGAGLDLTAIRRELGAGVGVQGLVEIAMDLRGRGASTRALAATLNGEAGAAMVGGRFSRAGMLRVGPDLTRILLLGNAPPEGITIRCLALRMNIRDGLGQSEALLLESSAGRIDGTLAVNFHNEVIAAQLRPDIRVLGANMRAPVGIGGTLSAPRVGVEPGQAVLQMMSDTVSNRLSRNTTLEWLRGGEGGPAGGECASQLRLARLGRAGRAPPPPATTVIPLVPRELQSPVQDVFRGIGGLLGGRR